MLIQLFLTNLPFLTMVCGKTVRDTDTIVKLIIKEQASMIKHCVSNLYMRNVNTKPDKPKSEKMVAFSAYPGKDLKNINANTKIVFGNIRTNIGNAYNPTTGVFTAPIDGVYAFHLTITVFPTTSLVIFIQVNDRDKVLLYGNARGYPNWYSPSQSYVSDLKKGDRVNLSSGSTAGGHVSHHSTFTGYRL